VPSEGAFVGEEATIFLCVVDCLFLKDSSPVKRDEMKPPFRGAAALLESLAALLEATAVFFVEEGESGTCEVDATGDCLEFSASDDDDGILRVRPSEFAALMGGTEVVTGIAVEFVGGGAVPLLPLAPGLLTLGRS
jgi:hypothetical protein